MTMMDPERGVLVEVVLYKGLCESLRAMSKRNIKFLRNTVILEIRVKFIVQRILP